MDDTLTLEGVEYVCPSSCTFGDYGGAGAMGLANIETLLESTEKTDEWSFNMVSSMQTLNGRGKDKISDLIEYDYVADKCNWEDYELPDIIEASGDFSSRAVYLRADKFEEEIAALADYPVLDDERMTRIELDWESEAFDSWAKNDLMADIDKDISDADAWECYRQAMEIENEYPTPEYNGSSIPVNRIKETFTRLVMKL